MCSIYITLNETIAMAYYRTQKIIWLGKQSKTTKYLS